MDRRKTFSLQVAPRKNFFLMLVVISPKGLIKSFIRSGEGIIVYITIRILIDKFQMLRYKAKRDEI